MNVMLAPLATEVLRSENKIEVIPGGWVRFLGCMGTDLDIVNDARQSYDVEHKEVTDDDAGLLNYLIRERHGTPTEGVEFKFQIKAPLPVTREWMRHRFASYNEISGRYVKQTLGFYHPDEEGLRTQIGKPGHYTYKKVNDANVKHLATQLFEDAYERSYKDYETLIDLGIAKELARNVLSQGMFTKFMYKTNARSLMNFLSLRNNERAMYEIRKYAEAIEKIFKKQLPLTHAAFINNGRIAP